MTSNAKLVALAGIAVALFGYAAFTLIDRPDAKVKVEVTVAPPPAARRASAPPDMRKRIAKAVDREAIPEVEADNVASYLARLEQRAAEAGQVTALHVEPGLQALAAAGASPEEQLAFAKRMEELSASLREPEPTDPPDLDGQLQLLHDEPSPQRRAKLVQRYVSSAQTLPPSEQVAALARLDEVAGARAEPMPPLPHE